MSKSFREALENRRTYYSISNKSLISDKEIEKIIEFAVKNIPSAFNSQSTRVVLLIGDSHRKLWKMTEDKLHKIVPEEAFIATKNKIDGAFASGYGTVLFFEDQSIVKGLQNAFPLYQENFPIWSQHTSAMHQLAIWTMLEEAGFGASLQHYNPLIDDEIAKEWKLSPDWKLIAQMPFGVPTQPPSEKEFKPLDERIKVFK